MKLAKGFTHKSRRATPWDGKIERTPMQEFLHEQYTARYDERHPSLTSTGETELINSYVPEKCPHCDSQEFKLSGRTKNGVQRYKCRSCSQTLTPMTHTIFEGHKISLSEWLDSLLNLFRYLRINADSWNNKNAFTTSRYGLEKVFLLLEDYHESLMLHEKVWLDETFYSVRSEDLTRTADGNKLRGLSVNPMCIGVACDKNTTICIYEGFGKPSQKKTYEAFKNRIPEGATLIHDKEKAHRKWVEKLKLKSITYDAREIKQLHGKENPLYRVNPIHFLLKGFLYAHARFNRDKLQGFLNLFSFVMNPPAHHLEKAEILLDLAFKNHKTLRYRDFYTVK